MDFAYQALLWNLQDYKKILLVHQLIFLVEYFPILNSLIQKFYFLIDQGFLGEIAICPQIIDEEAKKFGKSFESRLYHLIIHAVLHLLGFSHENMHNRKKMESIEKELMQKLNFADPYVY